MMKVKRVLSAIVAVALGFNGLYMNGITNKEETVVQAATGEPTYVTEVGPSYEGNPLKGMFPYSNRNTDNLPYSMEWINLPVSAVHIGEGEFDWTALEDELNAIAGRGHHAAFRFYYTYPMKSDNGFGVPQHVVDYVGPNGETLTLTPYGDPETEPDKYSGLNGWGIWPDHSNEYLLQSMEEFIAAFGAKYDGDARIGFITLGLLGFWGEWHSWPYSDSSAYPEFVIPKEAYVRALDAYDAAFDETQLCVREPKSDIDYTNYNIGYHDDSFAYSTLPTQDYHFLSLLEKYNQLDKWRTQAIGGELYPPIQRYDYLSGGMEIDGLVIEDYTQCVEDTHVSWMINNSYADYTGEEISRAREASVQLGYDFQVVGSWYDEMQLYENVNSNSVFNLEVGIKNIGVAPFYYGKDKWPVVVGLAQGGDILKEWETEWELKNIMPDGNVYYFETVLDNLPAIGYENYEIYMKVLNPLDSLELEKVVARGNILGFANAEQRDDGWLKIGELNYGLPETEMEPETDIVLDETMEIKNTITAWESNGYIYCNLAHNVDYEHWQLFVNSDGDATVGYTGSGFDYFIQDDVLMEYLGTGLDWNWSSWSDTNRVDSEVTESNILAIIPKSMLGNVSYPIVLQYHLSDSSWSNVATSDLATIEVESSAFEWVPVQNDSDIPVRFDYTYTDEAGNEISENVEVNGYVEYYDAMAFTKTEKVVCDGTDLVKISGNDDYYSGGNNATVQIVNTGVSDNSQMLIEGTVWQIPEDKYGDATVYSQSAIGQMQLDVPEVFCVTSKTTYYMLKITTQTDEGDIVTHLPFRITVIPGKVSLRAYQMNVNTAEGSVSEFNPSFRVVSRAPKIMTGSDGRLHAVVEFGTLYAIDSEVSGGEMAEGVESVVKYRATQEGVLQNWPNSLADVDKDDYNYYALTFKSTKYYLDMLTFNFKLKAYAKLDDGTMAYQTEFVSETSIYDIAKVLYDNEIMSNQSGHEFLYNHVLNIVSMEKNRLAIATKMLEVLNGYRTSEENKVLINNVYIDMQYYVNVRDVYWYSRYSMRPEFDSATLYNGEKNGVELLRLLNEALSAECTTLGEWIRTNVEEGKGFYPLIEWNAYNSLVPAN